MKKQETINIKQFMQSERYANLNEEIKREINHDSINYNLKIPQQSNLIDFDKRIKEFTKTVAERVLLKQSRKAYKKQLLTIN